MDPVADSLDKIKTTANAAKNLKPTCIRQSAGVQNAAATELAESASATGDAAILKQEYLLLTTRDGGEVNAAVTQLETIG